GGRQACHARVTDLLCPRVGDSAVCPVRIPSDESASQLALEMNQFFCRVWTTAMLVGLSAYVLLQGVVPALSRIDSDFPNYFTAARIARDAQDATRLYDDPWFQQQMRRYGVGSDGKFAPFPPPTALLLVPLAHLTPLAALRVVTAVNVVCLLLSMFLLVRM